MIILDDFCSVIKSFIQQLVPRYQLHATSVIKWD